MYRIDSIRIRPGHVGRSAVWVALCAVAVPASWWLIARVGAELPWAEPVQRVGLWLYMALVTAALTALALRLGGRAHGPGSLYDPLTATFEPAYLRQRLREELTHARRKGRPLTLLKVDVDQLHRINQRYGRDCGDQVLRRVAAELRRQVREDDAVARVDGDAFIVILRESSMEDALRVASRMREAIQRASYLAGQGQVFAVTASVGVVSYWRSGAVSADLLMQLVDDALQQAKAEGCNRVVVAGRTRHGEVSSVELPL